MDIPLNAAYKESSFRGKFDFKYNPYLTSEANAYGAMQVQYATARPYWKSLTINQLLYDNEINVISSLKYFRELKGDFKSWTTVASIYNQGWKGKDSINQYATDVAGGRLWYQKSIRYKKQSTISRTRS